MKKISTMLSSTGQTCDGGNRTLLWSQLCDGIVDCHDRFDEEGHFCSKFTLSRNISMNKLTSFLFHRTLCQQSLFMSTERRYTLWFSLQYASVCSLSNHTRSSSMSTVSTDSFVELLFLVHKPISLLLSDDNYSPYQLLKDWNFYIGLFDRTSICQFSFSIAIFSAVAIATIVVLLVITGIVILIKYLIRTHRRRRTLRSTSAKVKFSPVQWNTFFHEFLSFSLYRQLFPMLHLHPIYQRHIIQLKEILYLVISMNSVMNHRLTKSLANIRWQGHITNMYYEH